MQDAAKQFAGDLRPWATALQGRDEVSPDDWRQARSWGSRLSPAEIGQAAQQVHPFQWQPSSPTAETVAVRFRAM